MKYSILVLTALTLSALISCNSPKQDTEQTRQSPMLPQLQEQNNTESTDSIRLMEGETEVQPSIQQNNEGAMLNPPHGEPNHRCDIPVGAPLNSPAVNTTQQPPSSQAQATKPDNANNATAPTIENAKRLNSTETQNTTTPATGTKPTLNPAHGQPWHRCDIAVGSPLP